MDSAIDRRRFLGGLAATLGGLGGLGWLGCGVDEAEYTEADRARLARQMEREAASAGQGAFGKLRFRGYRGLAELPWFELAGDGRLRTAVELPGIVDVHTHLGMSLFLAPEIEQTRRTERVRHILDCDHPEQPCDLDLDVYMNSNFTEASSSSRTRELLGQFLFGSPMAETQTAANLVAEMDDIGVTNAVVLPIDFGVFGARDQSERWISAIEAGGFGKRLVPFCSVHPRDPDRLERLRAYAARGARGVKLHPEMQRFFPDDPGAMDIYAECERLGLVVLFHAGRSGIEPEFMRPYALIRRYVPAVAEFPRVSFIFGHGGARDLERAIAVAREHRNVWLGCSSLGVSQLAEALAALGPERLVFGSDWPFYHLASTLAKLLVITEGDPAARTPILRANAAGLLGIG